MRQELPSLFPDACGDEEALRRFVEASISPNAWPIHSPSLRRLILARGLDLEAARGMRLSLAEVDALLKRAWLRAGRADRLLGIDNAFHTPLHNFEVLVRLLVLEWPPGTPMPEAVRRAPLQAHTSFESVRPALLELIGALLGQGVSGHVIARDALAALGHDYGHSGGTDRTGRDGQPAALTHEETAERHVAKLGIELGYPAALILESMAGIRATTFFSRPGRARIVPANDFERRLTLADVMGCALPAGRWLTHVALPVLEEKLPQWKARMAEIAARQEEITALERALPGDDPGRAGLEQERETLVAEHGRIIRDLEEWFKSERGFLLFIRDHKLAPVAGAPELWGAAIAEKVALVEAALEQKARLAPLVARGFAFLEEYVRTFANAGSLEERIGRDDVDPDLRALLLPFVSGG